MTDYITETPNLARYLCPGCEPEADPTVEILEYRYCTQHIPDDAGQADHVVTPRYLVGSGECEGLQNKTWCDGLHRGMWGAS